jgi:hypothetical protein
MERNYLRNAGLDRSIILKLILKKRDVPNSFREWLAAWWKLPPKVKLLSWHKIFTTGHYHETLLSSTPRLHACFPLRNFNQFLPMRSANTDHFIILDVFTWTIINEEYTRLWSSSVRNFLHYFCCTIWPRPKHLSQHYFLKYPQWKIT